MDARLNVLILEDRPADAELMVEELHKAGFAPEWRRVDTEREYLAALDPALDVILADHSLPQYDSLRALDALKQHGIHVPFIIISGTIDPELAVALMKQGAADYLCKDRMQRLGQAVIHALEQKRLREENCRAQQALRDSEVWLRALIDNSQDGIAVIDRDANIRYSSPSVCRILGLPPEAHVGESGFLRIHPDHIPKAKQTLALLQTPGQAWSDLYRIQHQDGSWRWVDVTFTSLLDVSPVNGIVVNYRDVTERRHAEQSLQVFRTLLDHTNDAIEVVDPATGRFLDVNEKACTALGFTREEFLKLTMLDVEEMLTQWPPHTLTERTAKTSSFIVEGRHRRKDGSTFPVEINVNFIRLDRDYLVAVVRDITERKRTEEKVHLQAAALEAAANSIVITDRQGTIVWTNKAFTQLTGYAFEEVRGKNPRVLKSGRHDAAFYEDLWRTILAGKVWHGELVNRRKDGSLYTEELTITPVRAGGGEVTHFIAIKQNVTERKQAEASLRASEATLDAISAAALDAIVLIDSDGNVMFWNRAAERTLGYSASEIMGKNLHSLLTPQRYKPDFDKGLAMFKQTGQGALVGNVVEVSALHRDGHEFPVEVSLGAVRLNDQWCGVGVVRDITERKRVEAEKNRLIAIMEASPDFVGTASIREQVLYVNRGGRSLIGLDPDEDLSATCIADYHPAWVYRLLHDTAFPEAIRHGHWRGEIALLARDGREIPVLGVLVTHKLPTGEPEYISLVAHDISVLKQTEMALRNNLAYQTALLEAIPLPVFVRTLDGRYQAANNVFCEYLGKKELEVIGQPVEDIFPAAQAASYRAKDQELVLCPGRQVYEGQLTTATQGVREVVFYKASVLGSDGDVTAIVGAILDVTDVRQAERDLKASEARFRRITTNMLDLVVQVSPEGIYEYVTPSTLTVLGYRAEELLGHSFFPLMYPDDLQGAVAAFKASMETGVPAFGEYRFRKANGEYIWLEVAGRRLLDNDGKVLGGLIACRDVTARRQAEDEIRKLNAELEQKVHDRTAQLEAANKELESFAYSVSHDLRAPLRSIDGFSQALLEDYNDKLDAEGQDYLRRVRVATQRMNRLVEDILQLSRLNRSAMTLAEVDLSAIAGHVVAELQAADPARHVEICLKPGLMAHGDARLLEVVLTNLLGNAWKFTSKSENARIELGVSETHGQCAFFVRDNGAGFDMANVERLFGAFQRLHTEAEFAGTGIGLATVQRIIRRHGGEVWAEGAVGKGATFTFTLGQGPEVMSSHA